MSRELAFEIVCKSHRVAHPHSALVEFLKVNSIHILHYQVSRELAFEKLCPSHCVSHLHSAQGEILKSQLDINLI